jgi:cytoskeletal protein RodZ
MRLEQELSLDQISSEIFVKVHYLEALENNQFELLPSDVQGKGFLRLYAKYLDLPVDQLIISWENKQLINNQSIESDTEQVQKKSTTGQEEDTSNNLTLPLEKYDNLLNGTTTVPDISSLPASQIIFKEIGNQLREQREKLSISLFDVEKYTRLKPNQIADLENGKIEELPSPVQAKGMLNNYATFLQVDSEKLLLKFADGLQAQLAEKRSTGSKGSISQTVQRKSPAGFQKLFTLDLVIGSSMILFLLLFSIWGLIQISSSGSEPMDIDAPEIVEMLQVTPSLQIDESLTSLPPTSVEPGVSQTQVGEENQLLNGTEQITETIPADDAPIQLYIVAVQRAYLKVIVDGNTEFDGRTTPGNAYQFSGDELIELTTGNAGAIQVFHNQNNLGSLGFVGEVVRLQFEITGIITPTPQFTATSTSTPVSTVTLQPTATMPTPTPSVTSIAP